MHTLGGRVGRRSLWSWFVASVVVLAFVAMNLATGTAAIASPLSPETVRAQSFEPCPAEGDVGDCDADGDTIPDTVERVVCDAATCATGREDVDSDGIPDWTEVMACGTAQCASPTTDKDDDGIPDYAEILTCGTASCSNGYEDADGNGVTDWASFVICGTRNCATGAEDYDGDGVSDSVELAACVKHITDLASTGSNIAIGLIVALSIGLILAGMALSKRQALFRMALGLPNVAASETAAR